MPLGNFSFGSALHGDIHARECVRRPCCPTGRTGAQVCTHKGGRISRIVSRSPCNVGLWAALLILSPGGTPSRVMLRRFFVVPSARCGVSPGLWGIGPAGGCVPVVCDRSQSWKTLCPYIGIPSSCAAVGTRGTPGSSAIFGRFPIKEKGLCANL